MEYDEAMENKMPSVVRRVSKIFLARASTYASLLSPTGGIKVITLSPKSLPYYGTV
jgi:hypothetical protein